jgi:hypothetical protein
VVKKAKKSTKRIAKYSYKKKKTVKPGPKVAAEEEEDYKPPRSFKIVGYCPKCDMFLSTKDFASKMIFVCVKCGLRKHKKYLKPESKRQLKKQVMSKKQYLREAASKSKLDNLNIKSSNLNDLPDVSTMGNVQK